jgi:hypothetical protein
VNKSRHPAEQLINPAQAQAADYELQPPITEDWQLSVPVHPLERQM